MAKNRLYRVLSHVVELKPGEEILAISLFFYLFLITSPFHIIKAIRNAFLLDRLGYKNLPIAYLLTAILMGLFVHLHSKLQEKIPRRMLLVFSLFFFISNCFLFWLLLPLKWDWLPYVFWIWANVFIYVLMTQFWITVNDVFNPREAKRLIGFFVSGGILGGIVGGLLTGILASDENRHNLLFLASGLLIFCGFVVNYIFVFQKKRSIHEKTGKGDITSGKGRSKVGFKECFSTVTKHYYLKLLAAVVTITVIVSTFIDFQFNTVIFEKLATKGNLTSFFGYFNAGISILPLFFSLFMTSGFIKRYGIRISLLLFPLVLFFGSLGIAVFVLIGFAIFLKGSDQSLDYSINQAVRELLYIPVSPEFKYRAKIFIDMFLNRLTRSIGALILLLIIQIQLSWQSTVRVVSLASLAFIFLWVFLNLKVSKEYVSTVKDKLKMKWDRADKLVAEKVDIDYTKLVFDLLESKDRSSVLYAMHLFDLIKQDKLTPDLRKLISYKSDEIKASSLGVLLEADETTVMPESEDYIDDDVLKKEIKEIMSLDVYQEVMKSYVDKLMEDESQEAELGKMEVAKAISLMDSQSPFIQRLEELLQEESPEISKYAMESAAKIRRRDYVPAIVQKLTNPSTRQDARAALEKYGPKILGTLSDYLGDTEENIEVRKELTSVFARIGSQEAVDFLSWELEEEQTEIDSDIIDALDRIRTERPKIRFQVEIIKTKIARGIKEYYESLIGYYESKPVRSKESPEKSLTKNLADSMMNIFKLLGLIYLHEDIFKAYQNLKTGTKDSMAYAVELLDNTLEKEMRDVILPIVEDLPLSQRVRRCRSLLRVSPILKNIHGKEQNL